MRELINRLFLLESEFQEVDTYSDLVKAAYSHRADTNSYVVFRGKQYTTSVNTRMAKGWASVLASDGVMAFHIDCIIRNDTLEPYLVYGSATRTKKRTILNLDLWLLFTFNTTQKNEVIKYLLSIIRKTDDDINLKYKLIRDIELMIANDVPWPELTPILNGLEQIVLDQEGEYE